MLDCGQLVLKDVIERIRRELTRLPELPQRTLSVFSSSVNEVDDVVTIAEVVEL